MKTLIAALVLSVALAPTPAPTQSPEPLTMGRLVQLMTANQLPMATLQAALKDTDAELRAVAARVVGVGRVMSLQDDIINVFAAETDKYAAYQMAVTLVVMGTPEAIAAVEGHLGRLTPGGVLTYARWLGRTDPDRFVERVPELARLLDTRDEQLAPVALLSAAAHPEKRDVLLRAMMTPPANAGWKIIVGAALAQRGSTVDLSLVSDALSAADTATRSQSVWAIIRELDNPTPPPIALLEAAQRDPGSDTDPLTWERFGREIIARRVSRRTVPDRSAFIAAEARAHAEEARSLLFSKDLRRPEQSALRTALNITSDEQARKSSARLETVRRISKMRVATPPSPGFIGSLFAATGCVPPRTPAFGVIAMTFGSDRRPLSATTDTGIELSPGCASALAGLRHVTLADDAEIPDITTQQWIILPVTEEFVSCTNERQDLSTPDITDDLELDIEKPKKTRDVPPTYPPGARADGVQGLVVIDAIIGRTGCVQQAAVIRSVAPSLDFAAIRAVSQWRYAPALLRKEPVAVSMTVTVNFALH